MKKKLHLNLDQHPLVDIAYNIVGLASPYLLGFADVPAARISIQAFILFSAGKDMLTRYRYSFIKLIPIGIHLCLDLAVGTAIAISPWVFGFSSSLSFLQKFFFVAFGLSAYLVVSITSPKTEKEKSLRRIFPGQDANVRSLAL